MVCTAFKFKSESKSKKDIQFIIHDFNFYCVWITEINNYKNK